MATMEDQVSSTVEEPLLDDGNSSQNSEEFKTPETPSKKASKAVSSVQTGLKSKQFKCLILLYSTYISTW